MKTTKTILFTSLTTLLAALSLSATANAANVTWQTPFAVTDGITGNVSTDGTFERACNFAGATTTVNGVTFTAAPVGSWNSGPNSYTWGNTTLTAINHVAGSPSVGAFIFGDSQTSTAEPYNSASSQYKALIGTNAWGYNLTPGNVGETDFELVHHGKRTKKVSILPDANTDLVVKSVSCTFGDQCLTQKTSFNENHNARRRTRLRGSLGRCKCRCPV